MDSLPQDFGTLAPRCPKCGSEVHKLQNAFQCVRGDFWISKIVSSRMLEASEVEKLIAEKQVGPLQGFRGKMGTTFSAILKLNPEFKLEFEFHAEP